MTAHARSDRPELPVSPFRARPQFRGRIEWVRAVAFAFALLSSGVVVGAQAKPPQVTVDLRSGALNGRPIGYWTLDSLTDELGRPTGVSPGIEGITGTQVLYHDRGLSLWFRPKEKDPAEHLWLVTIYFARDWDESHSAWYQVFTGTMTPAVDGGWKQSRLESEFASLHPVIKTVEDSRREAQASGLTGLGIRSAATDFLKVTTNGIALSFALEPNTKFLERLTLEAATVR